MAEPCSPDYLRMATQLGIHCGDAPAVVGIRNPLELTNWTLPVVEFTLIAGAVVALFYAVRRARRGDPTSLVLWLSAVVYLLVIEPPIYFPDAFGMPVSFHTAFAHNVFTVDFLYDRLPLYIVALYPALLTLAFDLVRALGVFSRYGALVGAVCVGFVHSCFYEVFDHLGPQLRWWAWNSDGAALDPMLRSVPMSSAVVFAALAPATLAFLVYRFVAAPTGHLHPPGAVSLIVRTVVIGAFGPLAVFAFGIPVQLVQHTPVIAPAIYYAVVAALAAVSIPVLLRCWRATRAVGTRYDTIVVRIFGTGYLIVFAFLWAAALPDYFAAVNGITPHGTPIGVLAYAVVCFMVAAVAIAAAQTLHAAAAVTSAARDTAETAS